MTRFDLYRSAYELLCSRANEACNNLPYDDAMRVHKAWRKWWLSVGRERVERQYEQQSRIFNAS